MRPFPRSFPRGLFVRPSAPHRLRAGWALLLSAGLFGAIPGVAEAGWAVRGAAQAVYSEAVLAQARGELEAALAGYDDVLRVDPGCGTAAHGRGMVLLRLGQLDAAEAVARQLAADFPKQAEAHTLLSGARFVKQNFAGAKAAAEAALKLEPDGIASHAAMLQVLLRLGETSAARALAAQARERLPSPVGACMEVAVLAELREPVTGELADRCAAAGPELIGWMPLGADQSAEEELAYVREGLARINAGDAAGALLLLDPVVRAQPQRGDARALRGIARARIGELSGAIEDLRAATTAPDWIVVHRSGAISGVVRASDARSAQDLRGIAAGTLVLLLVEQGQLAEAEAAERAALARSPDAELLLAARARRLAAEGAVEPALALVERLSTSADYDVQKVIVDVGVLLGRLPEGALRGLRETAGPGLLRWASAREAAGDAAGCLAALGEPAALHPELLRLGWSCGLRAGALDRAEAWRREGGPELTRSRPATAYNHALALRQAGRGEEARALIAPLLQAPPEAEAGPLLHLGGLLALDAGDLEGALALASAPAAPPALQAQVGARLLKASRPEAAGPLLRRACPALQGDEASACAANLALIGG